MLCALGHSRLERGIYILISAYTAYNAIGLSRFENEEYSHKLTATFGLGGRGGGGGVGAVIFLPEKITQFPNAKVLKSGCKCTQNA